MFVLLVLVTIGSNTLSLISGLSLQSKNTFVTTNDFSLMCKLQGTVTSSIIIKDPLGGNAGICYPQPTGCGSGAGNTITINDVGDTVFIDIHHSNINIPSSEGNWTCTNGTTDAIFQVKIFSINKPKVWTESTSPVSGTQVHVQIDCIYPYPDEIRIDYVKESTKAVLKSTTGPTFTNGSASNCNVTDTRAISMKGTFPLSGDKLNGAKVLIAAVVLVNGDILDIGYSNFTFQSEGCKYSDVELIFGGVSCFLIVLITSIIMLIILGCKILLEIFGGKYRVLHRVIARVASRCTVSHRAFSRSVAVTENNRSKVPTLPRSAWTFKHGGRCFCRDTRELYYIKQIKVIIIIVFDLVALIIGLALGFGLTECDQRDLGLGLGLGFGFILAIALVLTLYIYHKQCGSKKENEDENRFSLDSCFRKCQVKPEKEIESPPKFNSKKPEDSPKRVGSPASTSNIKMESKNKTDVLKGDQSALKQKVLHSPLPLPPVDNSQPSKASDDKLSRKKLDPIAVENEEANSSEKKKKKKKRKKKKIDNETADNNVEEAGDNGNLN